MTVQFRHPSAATRVLKAVALVLLIAAVTVAFFAFLPGALALALFQSAKPNEELKHIAIGVIVQSAVVFMGSTRSERMDAGARIVLVFVLAFLIWAPAVWLAEGIRERAALSIAPVLLLAIGCFLTVRHARKG